MRSRIPIIALGLVLLLLVMSVSGEMIIPLSDKGKENSKAPEHSPVIDENNGNFTIGRIDFVHYAKPTGPAKPPKTTTCYKLMGVKWASLPVVYSVNPATQEPLDDAFVLTAIATAAETWDDATGKELFTTSGQPDNSAVYGLLDGKNSIAFGGYKDQNVIAVTTVWYYRTTGQIIESDMLFNEYWTWGEAASVGSQMDIQNIATHEFGHVVGLADLYTDSCKEVTMYGYSTLDEVKKQTLEPSDITGLQKIYG
jgi:hypothetical protein